LEYISKRWKQLHELEIKRSDAVLNYLFLVSGGAAAATLAYIGNLAKDGATIPSGVVIMLGLFAASLLLVGLLKIFITYKVVGIFREWQDLVNAYYSNNLPWSEVLEKDKAKVRKNGWVIHTIGWSAYLTLVAGVVIGFVRLDKETQNVRSQKNTTIESTVPSSALKGNSNSEPAQDRSEKQHNRNVTKQPAPSTTKKEVEKTNGG
jgi:hypothetical protein